MVLLQSIPPFASIAPLFSGFTTRMPDEKIISLMSEFLIRGAPHHVQGNVYQPRDERLCLVREVD